MSWWLEAIILLGTLITMWLVCNIAGLMACRGRSRRERYGDVFWPIEPYNWRVFLGPKVYYDWYMSYRDSR